MLLLPSPQGQIVNSKQLEINPAGVPSTHAIPLLLLLLLLLPPLQGQIVTSKQLEINPSWCAPEALSCDTRMHYGTYSDVYSYGICLWELLTWRLPWEAPYAYCGDAYCPQPHYHQLHITNAVRAGAWELCSCGLGSSVKYAS
jgi:serine/threonine protein kinase